MCTPNYALERRAEVGRGRPIFHPGRHGLRPEAGSTRVLPVPDRARDVDVRVGHLIDEVAQEQRRRDRAARPRTDVDQISNFRLDLLLVGVG